MPTIFPALFQSLPLTQPNKSQGLDWFNKALCQGTDFSADNVLSLGSAAVDKYLIRSTSWACDKLVSVIKPLAPRPNVHTANANA